jgi:hypothetical protein
VKLLFDLVENIPSFALDHEQLPINLFVTEAKSSFVYLV